MTKKVRKGVVCFFLNLGGRMHFIMSTDFPSCVVVYFSPDWQKPWFASYMGR